MVSPASASLSEQSDPGKWSVLLFAHLLMPLIMVIGYARLVASVNIPDHLVPGSLSIFSGGVLCVYLLERILPPDKFDNPIRSMLIGRHPGFFGLLLATSFALLVFGFLQADLNLLIRSVPLLVISLMYPLLRKVFLLKTLCVCFCWLLAIRLLIPFPVQEALIPVFDAKFITDLIVSQKFGLSLILIGLQIFAGLVYCDFKDFRSDSMNGSLSLVVILGREIALRLVLFVLLSCLILGLYYQLAPALQFTTILLLLIQLRPDFLDKELTGALLVDACLGLPLFLLGA
jgi:hypothetical protein